MSFQFSHQFHQHWLEAPVATRNKIKADLEAIVDLLKPETALVSWQKKHGIYITDTTKAEQVGLFDASPKDASSTDLPHTETSSIDDAATALSANNVTLAQSHFLRNVTAGLGDAENTQSAGSNKSGVTETTQQPKQTPNASEPQLNKTELKKTEPQASEPLPKELAETLQQLEAKIDDYLAFSMQNIKEDVMAWLVEELQATKPIAKKNS